MPARNLPHQRSAKGHAGGNDRGAHFCLRKDEDHGNFVRIGGAWELRAERRLCGAYQCAHETEPHGKAKGELLVHVHTKAPDNFDGEDCEVEVLNERSLVLAYEVAKRIDGQGEISLLTIKI